MTASRDPLSPVTTLTPDERERLTRFGYDTFTEFLCETLQNSNHHLEKF